MKWRVFACSDCNTPEGVLIVQVADDVSEDAGCVLDYCPSPDCGGYLSLLPMGDVEIKGAGPLALLHMRERDAEREGLIPE